MAADLGIVKDVINTKDILIPRYLGNKHKEQIAINRKFLSMGSMHSTSKLIWWLSFPSEKIYFEVISVVSSPVYLIYISRYQQFISHDKHSRNDPVNQIQVRCYLVS